ncbi:MAG: nucleotide exchange factor GrpE [Candidatus Omnitrophica bacterium]|nr:nucleotide exchange factor GrpE [Candidatus Omnitrophota bacterium]MBU4487452.1 nucleotide exchange factor GrpE [Candidatus Omnitrophota bacterium]MCG2705098.1 nucleotide exchange factor GrpE [Candidatus Omnitrophota bacterium]
MKDKENQGEKDEALNISKAEYESLKERAEEKEAFYDKYLRASAELENTKKRLEKDKADSIKYANTAFMLEFLPILDNLEIAERHIKEAKDFKAVQEGVDMIQVQIQRFLKDIGVEKIKAVGEKFDPHQHEVVEVDETGEGNDDVIVEELKPGYRLNGVLLRPALVKIAKKKG